jgi:hypothetical protein
VDGAVLIVIFLCIAIVGAALYGGSVRAWLRAEWRAGSEETFYRSDYLVNPRLGSVVDPRVAKMMLKQRALGKRMRRKGKTLFSASKSYVPVLTKQVPLPDPPKAAEVYPIRRNSNKGAAS